MMQGHRNLAYRERLKIKAKLTFFGKTTFSRVVLCIMSARRNHSKETHKHLPNWSTAYDEVYLPI